MIVQPVIMWQTLAMSFLLFHEVALIVQNYRSHCFLWHKSKKNEDSKIRSDFRLFTIPYADQSQAMQNSCWLEQEFTLWYDAKLTVQHWNSASALFKGILYLHDDYHIIIISAHKEWKRTLILHQIQNTVSEYKECPLNIRVLNYVRWLYQYCFSHNFSRIFH